MYLYVRKVSNRILKKLVQLLEPQFHREKKFSIPSKHFFEYVIYVKMFTKNSDNIQHQILKIALIHAN